MELKLSPIEQLDITLNFIFEENENHYYVIKRTIEEYLYNKHKFSLMDIMLCIDKLEDDKNIRYIENDNSNQSKIVITYSGKILKLNGGYTNQIIQQLKNIEQNDFRHKLIVYGSIGAAFGTIGLLIFELLKYISSLFSCV